jgi:hypothetical protein
MPAEAAEGSIAQTIPSIADNNFFWINAMMQ